MGLYEILDIVWYSFAAVILWPIMAGASVWRRLHGSDKCIFWFLVALLLFEIIATILRFNNIRNHFMHYFRTLAAVVLTAYFYRPFVAHPRFLIGSSVLLILAIPVEVFGFTGFNQVNTITETLAWLQLEIYAFLCLKAIIDTPQNGSLRQNPLVYHPAGLLILGFFQAGKACFVRYFIETSVDLYFFMDTLVIMMGAVAYCLFAIGFKQRNPTLQPLLSR